MSAGLPKSTAAEASGVSNSTIAAAAGASLT
jgi:hypothetical protein